MRQTASLAAKPVGTRSRTPRSRVASRPPWRRAIPRRWASVTCRYPCNFSGATNFEATSDTSSEKKTWCGSARIRPRRQRRPLDGDFAPGITHWFEDTRTKPLCVTGRSPSPTVGSLETTEGPTRGARGSARLRDTRRLDVAGASTTRARISAVFTDLPEVRVGESSATAKTGKPLVSSPRSLDEGPSGQVGQNLADASVPRRGHAFRLPRRRVVGSAGSSAWLRLSVSVRRLSSRFSRARPCVASRSWAFAGRPRRG